jgi:hypothetical protein
MDLVYSGGSRSNSLLMLAPTGEQCESPCRCATGILIARVRLRLYVNTGLSLRNGKRMGVNFIMLRRSRRPKLQAPSS